VPRAAGPAYLNSVLRRIAGLDEAHRPPTSVGPRTTVKRGSSMQAPKQSSRSDSGIRVTGEGLNRRYRLGARYALYHKDGTLYERLNRFPAVYCNPRGFVLLQSQEQFHCDPRLNIGQKVNIPGGLSSHPRYEQFPTD
jgi:hypothetical protein